MKLIRRSLFAMLMTLVPALALAGPININTADAPTISENLKGVGAQKAEAIVAYREANGPFQKTEDLLKVKGIGEKTLEANRELILLK